MKIDKWKRKGYWYKPEKNTAIKNSKAYKIDCRYCNKPAKIVTGEIIYPHRGDLKHLKFWLCKDCNAYVGCHRAGHNQGNGEKPFGELANSKLRGIRMATHKEFDKLWNTNDKKQRTKCYKELSEYLGIEVNKTHIGIFDIEECEKTIKFSKDKLCQ